jgi:hypothetical protein
MTTNPNDKTEVPMWTDVPLDLHPGTLALFAPTLDQDGSPGRSAFKTAREAMAHAYRAYKKINDAEKAVQPTKHPSSKVRQGKRPPVVTPELLDGVDRLQKKELPAFQKRYEFCKLACEQLQKTVTSTFTDADRDSPHGIARAQAIVAFVQNLPDSAPEGKTTRMGFLEKAFSIRDTVTISAVLHAPPYLSGLTDEMHARLKEQAEKTFAPADAEVVKDMERLLAHMRRAGDSFKRRVDRVLARGCEPAVQKSMKNYLAIKALREG